MSTWSVRVELALADPPDDEALDALTDRLVDFGAAVALEDRNHLAVQLTVDTRTRRAAFDRGDKAVEEAATAAGVVVEDIVEVQVLTQTEFDHRLLQPRVPELWGPTEAAQFLEVTTVRVDQLHREFPQRLPVLLKLAGKQGTRIWLADTVRRFKPTWHRQVGRPKKVVPPEPEPEPEPEQPTGKRQPKPRKTASPAQNQSAA